MSLGKLLTVCWIRYGFFRSCLNKKTKRLISIYSFALENVNYILARECSLKA